MFGPRQSGPLPGVVRTVVFFLTFLSAEVIRFLQFTLRSRMLARRSRWSATRSSNNSEKLKQSHADLTIRTRVPATSVAISTHLTARGQKLGRLVAGTPHRELNARTVSELAPAWRWRAVLRWTTSPPENEPPRPQFAHAANRGPRPHRRALAALTRPPPTRLHQQARCRHPLAGRAHARRGARTFVVSSTAISTWFAS